MGRVQWWISEVAFKQPFWRPFGQSPAQGHNQQVPGTVSGDDGSVPLILFENPGGKKFPGAEQPGEFPDRSTWKLAWLSYNGWWQNDVDLILPAWAASFRIVGNSLNPDISIDDSKDPDWWQWGEWMRFSFWLECGPDPAHDPGRIRWQVVTEGEQTQVVADGKDTIMAGGEPPFAWKRLNIPGWSQNKDISSDTVEALYDDIYLATGENANARLELTDNMTYENSTRMQLCDIQSWSSNRVSAILRTGSIDSVVGSTLHLTTADEQQAVSMEV